MVVAKVIDTGGYGITRWAYLVRRPGIEGWEAGGTREKAAEARMEAEVDLRDHGVRA